MIFNVQRYSTHDGEGIRTLIFYKGCPLSCHWCSNPESQSFDHSLMYDSKLCLNFADCHKVNGKAITPKAEQGIKIHRELLNNTESFREVCVSKALTVSGENKTVDELLIGIEKDRPFFKENGGVTLSGGEPLAQGDELVELLKQVKSKQIGLNIETSLHVKWDLVDRCLGLVDVFLVDLKHLDSLKFKTYTNGDVMLVRDNLVRLTNSDARVVIRVPVIPGFNHTEKEIFPMIDFVLTLKNIREVHLLPYHTFGKEKYKMLDMEYKMGDIKQVADWELAPYIQYAESLGLKVQIGG
jgi:pyruvate formate lyase activating enzyme